MILRQSLTMYPLQFLLMLALFFVLYCPSSEETCRSISEKVHGICPYYNSTNEDRYHEDQQQELQQIDREEVILHFTPLFSSTCSPLARILLCSALFPFCSEHFVLHPCQEVCFSVYAACHHVFNAHWQQRPTFLNCSSFPSSPTLCLLPSSYVHHLPASNTSSNTSTSTQSSTSSIINTHPDSTSSHYPGTLQITNASPSPLSLPSSASFNTTLIFVTLALVLLIILLFVLVIIRAIFCFHRTPPVDSTNAITYTLPSVTFLCWEGGTCCCPCGIATLRLNENRYQKREKSLILHGWEQKIRGIWKWELLLALVIGQVALSS